MSEAESLNLRHKISNVLGAIFKYLGAIATIFGVIAGIQFLLTHFETPPHEIKIIENGERVSLTSSEGFDWDLGHRFGNAIFFSFDHLNLSQISGEISFIEPDTPDSNVVIVANKIILSDKVKIAARNLSLVASHIQGGVIDISGENARASGSDGIDGGNLVLAYGFVEGLNVRASGGDGANGKTGAAGARGRDGSSGRNGSCKGFGGWRSARKGGNGGDGEAGSPGTNGGNGGNGGAVKILSVASEEIIINVDGGNGGFGGVGGQGGVGGNPGRGGKGCTGLGGSQSNASDGQGGSDGLPGKDGENGRHGEIGNVQRRALDFSVIAERYREMSTHDFLLWLKAS